AVFRDRICSALCRTAGHGGTRAMKAFQFNPGTRALLYSFTTLVYLFVFVPLLFVIYASFDPNEIMSFPYKGFSLRWYKEFFASPTLYLAAGNSFLLAALSGLAATLL